MVRKRAAPVAVSTFVQLPADVVLLVCYRRPLFKTKDMCRTFCSKWLSFLILMTLSPMLAPASELTIGYLEQQPKRPPRLSTIDEQPADAGLQGARLGIVDNNSSGRFLGQHYRLQEWVLAPEGDAVAHAQAILAEGAQVLLLNLPGDAVQAIARLPEAADDLLFNVGSPDSALREEDCSANLLHSLPSRDMLTDALMQFLLKKQWTQLLLIEGRRSGDAAYAAALRTSAKKFGLKIVAARPWTEDGDLRRNAAQEVPVLTQAREYDVLLVADEDQDFGAFLLYNSWLPRPVAGTAGLVPQAWGPAMEQWGAQQMQNRFIKLAGRPMGPIDYAAWAAVRSLGEAMTRSEAQDIASLRRYLLSPSFALAGFKGTPMSYRAWNGQLRQPIALLHPQAVVALAPIEGFLHPLTELDTLGRDEPETACNAFR